MKSLPILLLLAAALWMPACDGCKSEAPIPATPEARILDIAETLPSGVEATFFLSDLKKSREALNLIKNKLPDAGVVDGYQKQFQANFGIDVLDRESWVNAGVAPDASVMVGAYRSRVLFLTYVENKQQFERILTEKAKSAFQIQAVTKNAEVGGHQMKVLSDDPGLQIAWLYKGKMALVVLPATSVDGALNEGSASLVLAELASTKKEASLSKSPGFVSYTKRFGTTHPASVYLNPAAYANDPEIQKAAADDVNTAAGLNWAKDNLTYAGLGLQASDKTIAVNGTLGLNPELAKSALAASKAGVAFDWTGFSTEHLLLGLRVSVDWPKMWQLTLDSLPDERKRAMLRDLKQAGAGMNLDLEADVLSKLTGNVGLFFYGLGGNAKGLAGLTPETLIRSAGVMAVIQMSSPEAVDTVINKLMTPLAMLATLRPVVIDDQPVDGWRVLEFTTGDAPGRVFINNDRILLASHAFGERAIVEYGDNKRTEARLKDSTKLDKGKAFGAAEPFNGLYLNGERARTNLGGLLMLFQPAQVLNQIEEASLQFGVDDEGGFMTFNLDLEAGASQPAEKSADAPAPTPAP